jgi:hypothetical protein
VRRCGKKCSKTHFRYEKCLILYTSRRLCIAPRDVFNGFLRDQSQKWANNRWVQTSGHYCIIPERMGTYRMGDGRGRGDPADRNRDSFIVRINGTMWPEKK